MNQSAHRVPALPQATLDLGELIAEHGERLLRSAALLCDDLHEAEDLVQETLIQAMRGSARFRGECAVYTWLYGILLNLCRRHRRKQRRLIYNEDRMLSETAPSRPVTEHDQTYCAEGLALALRTLSQEHREAIILRYYEGLKIDEIARVAGLSTGTVKSRLHYALRQLAQVVPGELNLFGSADTQTHYSE